jgi:hypothetical protein
MNGERARRKQSAMIGAGGQLERMDALLSRIKARLADIEVLLHDIADEWGEEDGVYRFYHQSYKVFERLQGITRDGFALITAIGGEEDPPCEWYSQIVREGTEHDFNERTNKEWLQQTRPILEAFWQHEIFPLDDGQIRQAARHCDAVSAERLGRLFLCFPALPDAS